MALDRCMTRIVGRTRITVFGDRAPDVRRSRHGRSSGARCDPGRTGLSDINLLQPSQGIMQDHG
jgi:hypothetical protein